MTDLSATANSIAPLFHHRPFRLLFITRTAANTANQMQAVAVGWLIYDLTCSALALGLIGLVQFLPPLVLSLIAGQVVDHYSRRLILVCCYIVEFIVSVGLLVLAAFADHPVELIFVLLLINAVARTFEAPALQSLVPSTVPREILLQAVSAHASAGKMSQLIGPALGGLFYALGAGVDFGLCALLIVIAGVASILLPIPAAPAERPKVTWTTLVAGIDFIWHEPAVLGAMSLDLAATLFGGVVALLPIFARDILQINSWGFGLLRAAPAIGALIVAVALSRTTISRHGGHIMFAAVAVYGLATAISTRRTPRGTRPDGRLRRNAGSDIWPRTQCRQAVAGRAHDAGHGDNRCAWAPNSAGGCCRRPTLGQPVAVCPLRAATAAG